MTQVTLYAIPNCNTVKKARQWLDDAGIDYDFHDYKKAGVPHDSLQKWIAHWGWEKVVNRAGMTWRKLSDAEKAAITGNSEAITLMTEKPSIIKRPIIEVDGKATLIGFNESQYSAQF